MNLKIILPIVLVLIVEVFLISLVSAEPCYPKNTPGCEDICGDEICGNSEAFDTCPGDCDYCVDTEDGADEFVKGTAIYNRKEVHEDTCTKDLEVSQGRPELYNELSESYCVNERGPNTGGLGGKPIKCEFGCEAGACLRSKPNYSECIDTDPENDVYSQGTVKYLDIEHRDECIDVTRGAVKECSEEGCILYEYYCNEDGQGLSPDNKITFDGAKCSFKCKNGVCVKPPCEGCLVDNEKCYPFGYREGGKYCSDDGSFVGQLKGNEACENNFECSSNVCVSRECVSQGLLQKIINWFKRLFGAE